MALRYYDDAIIKKLLKWIPENSNLRVLSPNETKRLLELNADDMNDQHVKLPIIALSRNNDIELLETTKQNKSFDGLKLFSANNTTAQLNVLPIKLMYQLDIYTKLAEEGDEYLRTFLFKLINNPVIRIDIPYNSNGIANNTNTDMIQHIANIRVQNTVSDTSDISERIYPGQFTRWTIQFEIQDAFFFSIPYRKNWKIVDVDLEVVDNLNAEVEADIVEKIL